MFHRHTKPEQSAARFPGHDSGFPPFHYFSCDCPLCTPMASTKGQLRQIDKITPSKAEQYYTPLCLLPYTSQTSLGLSFSLADRNASMSKRSYRLSASAVYLKIRVFGNVVLVERKGRTPRNCRIHLPPSMTASSSLAHQLFPNFDS